MSDFAGTRRAHLLAKLHPHILPAIHPTPFNHVVVTRCHRRQSSPSHVFHKHSQQVHVPHYTQAQEIHLSAAVCAPLTPKHTPLSCTNHTHTPQQVSNLAARHDAQAQQNTHTNHAADPDVPEAGQGQSISIESSFSGLHPEANLKL